MAYRILRGVGNEFSGQRYEVVGLSETDTEQEVLDILFLQASRFDDRGQPGVAEGADGGAISKGAEPPALGAPDRSGMRLVSWPVMKKRGVRQQLRSFALWSAHAPQRSMTPGRR